MSGHSKWSTIKRKKEATDAKRSNMYAKLLRAVEVAAREGGGNVEGNMTLASAVDKAKSFSVPSDNIERAIKRGIGADDGGARYEELFYEGYASGGVALLIEALTDNRNRTGQEVRNAFTRNNGNMGDQGSTAWMFARKGVIVVEKADAPEEDRMLELALEAGADDLRDDGDNWEVLSAPDVFPAVREAVKQLGIEPASAEVSMIPQNYVKLEGKSAHQMVRLMEALDDHDDVQHVWSNFDIEEKEIEASLA